MNARFFTVDIVVLKVSPKRRLLSGLRKIANVGGQWNRRMCAYYGVGTTPRGGGGRSPGVLRRDHVFCYHGGAHARGTASIESGSSVLHLRLADV